jgi:hypothetical protein
MQFVQHAVNVVTRVPQDIEAGGHKIYVANRIFRGERKVQCMELDLFVPMSFESDSITYECMDGRYFRMVLHLGEKNSVLEWEAPSVVTTKLVLDKTDMNQSIVVREFDMSTLIYTTASAAAAAAAATAASAPVATASAPVASTGITTLIGSTLVPATIVGLLPSSVPSASSSSSSSTTMPATMTGIALLGAIHRSSTSSSSTSSATASSTGLCHDAPSYQKLLAFLCSNTSKSRSSTVDTSFQVFLASNPSSIDAVLARLYYPLHQNFVEGGAGFDTLVKDSTLLDSVYSNAQKYLADINACFERNRFTFDKDRFLDRCLPAVPDWPSAVAAFLPHLDAYVLNAFDFGKVPLSLCAMLATLSHLQEEQNRTHYLPTVAVNYIQCVMEMTMRLIHAYILNVNEITVLYNDTVQSFKSLMTLILNDVAHADLNQNTLKVSECLKFEKALIALLTNYTEAIKTSSYEQIEFDGTNVGTPLGTVPKKEMFLFHCITGTEIERCWAPCVPSLTMIWQELVECNNIIETSTSSPVTEYIFTSLNPCTSATKAEKEINIAQFLSGDILKGFIGEFGKNINDIKNYYIQGMNLVSKLIALLVTAGADKEDVKTMLTPWLWIPFAYVHEQKKEYRNQSLQLLIEKHTCKGGDAHYLSEMYYFSLNALKAQHINTNDPSNLFISLHGLFQKFMNFKISYSMVDNASYDRTSNALRKGSSPAERRSYTLIDQNTITESFAKYVQWLSFIHIDSICNLDIFINESSNHDVTLTIVPAFCDLPNEQLHMKYDIYSTKTQSARGSHCRLFSLDHVKAFLEILDKTKYLESSGLNKPKEIPIVLKTLCFTFFLGDSTNNKREEYYNMLIAEIKVYDLIASIADGKLKEKVYRARNDYTRVHLLNILMSYCNDINNYEPPAANTQEETITKDAEETYHKRLLVFAENTAYLNSIKSALSAAAAAAAATAVATTLVINDGVLSRKVMETFK